MKLSRDFTLLIHFLFDQCLPPYLRDSKWFMWLPFKLFCGNKAKIYFNFKEKAPFLTAEEFRDIYVSTASVIRRATDLNKACVKAIEQHIVGDTVLDIACGRGFLTQRLANKYQVTGADIVIDPVLMTTHPEITFYESNIEKLSFANEQFDTVVCAHTLEHVQHLEKAIQELRRVAAKRLIIVVPKQRPYRYTFDLHLYFFPYAHDLLRMIGKQAGRQICKEIGGDWFYLEDKQV